MLNAVLIGADRTIWHVAGDQAGAEGVTVGEGFGGLTFPTFKQQETVSASQPGRVYRGTSYDPRKLPITLHVGDHGTGRIEDEWRNLDARFRAALSPEDVQRLAIVSNHGWRWWDMRLDEYAPVGVDRDPGPDGWDTYNAVFVADNPFPRGFGFTAPAPPGSPVEVFNGGERESWPVWTITAQSDPAPAMVTVGDGVRVTTLPPVSSGQSLVFDTNPARRSIVDGNGVSRRGELMAHDQRSPVNAGSSREYSSFADGPVPAEITVTLPFYYRSAW